MPQTQPTGTPEWISFLFAGLIPAYMVVSGYFARRNIARGRADSKGASWLAGFVASSFILYKLASFHYVPESSYVIRQIVSSLGEGLLFGLLTASGYVAAEPYVRRSWPQLMVSWQRLMSGRFRDPMIGRDLLVGIFAAGITLAITAGAAAVSGKSQILSLLMSFQYGVWPALGISVFAPASCCLVSFFMLGILAFLTGLLRKRWLSLLLTGVLVMSNSGPATLPELLAAAIVAVAFLIVLVRFGLLACSGFLLLDARAIPPLGFGRWYVGLAVIGLLVPMGLLVWSFYVSLGKQRIFGNALRED